MDSKPSDGRAMGQDPATQRLNMVNGQIRVADVNDLDLVGAFLDVPREEFVAPEAKGVAYLDSAQPSLGSTTRRLLPPVVLARLIQAAGVGAGDRVLDVGGGAGYGAAILARLGAKVVALESDPGAAEAARRLLASRGVETLEGDLDKGAAGKGPFVVIVVEGAFETAPEALLAELAENGRLVGVEAGSRAQTAVLVERRNGESSRRALFETRVAEFEAFRRARDFAF
ncbi:MAG: methyltransferase domain-containing protein [Bradyrhizobium sp.]|nr:MAG: methyltransferase domain-containing protein [Bradyrhizobium sp.]